MFFLNNKSLKYLHEGTFYLSARDSQFRPVIVINLNMMDSRADKWEE